MMLIYGDNLCLKFVDRVNQELRNIAEVVRSFHTSCSEWKNHINGKSLVVCVAHSTITIDDVSGRVSYISKDELSIDDLYWIRDNSYSCWFAGCCSANIDTSTANTEYNPNLSMSIKCIHSFIGLDYCEISCPVLTTYLFVAFLIVTNSGNYKWWKQDNVYNDLAVNGKVRKFMLAMWETASNLKVDFANQVLLPYHVSYPEVVHLALFKAVFPNKDFYLQQTPDDALKAYENSSSTKKMKKMKVEDRHKLILTSVGKCANENWLCNIEGDMLLEYDLPANTKYKFQVGQGEDISKIFQHALIIKKSKLSTIKEDVLLRLLDYTNNTLPTYNRGIKKHIALVCRQSDHGQKDVRMPRFVPFAKLLLQKVGL